MLVAHLNNQRIEASIAQKGPKYYCQGCQGELTLKKGRRVVHHFAHRPPFNCAWAQGETRAHLESKRYLAECLRESNWLADIEFSFQTPQGLRRADVATSTQMGHRIAFELQHSNISLDVIEKRAFSYASANITQFWIPFIMPKLWEKAIQRSPTEWFFNKFVAPPYIRWVHGLNNGHGMWMYDPETHYFWHARLAGHRIEVPVSNWYSQGGVEESAGGYSRWSKKWKELTLTGPYNFGQLGIFIETRSRSSLAGYNWPGGTFARFNVI